MLQERNFTDLAVPEDIQYQLRIDLETYIAADIPNCLWCFKMNLPPIVSENTRIIPFMLMTWTTAYITILNLIPKSVWVSDRVTALTQIFHPIFLNKKRRKSPEIARSQDFYGCGDRT